MSNKYQIRTLEDIFRLPTPQMMETCLEEISQSMKQARAFEEILKAIAESKGIKADTALEWPEVTEWVDDGQGIVGFSVLTPSGECIKCTGKLNAKEDHHE